MCVQVHECRMQTSEFGRLSDADMSGVVTRARALCDAVDAEVNYLHVDKARQFRELLGAFLRERAAYHRASAAHYEQAARLFSST